jgi:flagellar motor switch protein FliG
MDIVELSGGQKAATVLLSVDSETAAAVLKNFSESDLAAVTREMHGLGEVQPQVASAVLHEFATRSSESSSSIAVNPLVLRERLELAVGHDGARRVLQEIGADTSTEKIFQPLRALSPEEFYKLLADEHPQTIAVILSNVDPKFAAPTLALFSPEMQTDVIRRMATSQQTDGNILKKLGDLIRNKGTMESAREKSTSASEKKFKRVAELINLLGPAAEEKIFKELSGDSPEMVKRIRDMMFTFEDLLTLNDAGMRKVLMSVDTQLLAMALKTASEPLKQKVFANLSRRATETVTEELELLGRKPRSQVKAAQQQIVEIVRKMGATGELNLRGGSAEEDPLV